VLHWDIASLGNVGDKGDFGTLGVDLCALEVRKAGHAGLGQLGNVEARFANAKK